MKVAISIVAFLIFGAGYVLAKDYGLIGRMISDGVNTRERFELAKNGDIFTVKITPSRRGVYRYNARLTFGEANTTAEGYQQSGRFTLREIYCETAREIDITTINLNASARTFTYSALGRYGKEIRLPALKKRSDICLEVTTDALSSPVVDNAALSVLVTNMRPCWGIECLLD